MIVQMANAPTTTLATTMIAINAVFDKPPLLPSSPVEAAAETLAEAAAVLAVVLTREAAELKASCEGVTVDRMIEVVGTTVEVLVEVV